MQNIDRDEFTRFLHLSEVRHHYPPRPFPVHKRFDRNSSFIPNLSKFFSYATTLDKSPSTFEYAMRFKYYQNLELFSRLEIY